MIELSLNCKPVSDFCPIAIGKETYRGFEIVIMMIFCSAIAPVLVLANLSLKIINTVLLLLFCMFEPLDLSPHEVGVGPAQL